MRILRGLGDALFRLSTWVFDMPIYNDLFLETCYTCTVLTRTGGASSSDRHMWSSWILTFEWVVWLRNDFTGVILTHLNTFQPIFSLVRKITYTHDIRSTASNCDICVCRMLLSSVKGHMFLRESPLMSTGWTLDGPVRDEIVAHSYSWGDNGGSYGTTTLSHFSGRLIVTVSRPTQSWSCLLFFENGQKSNKYRFWTGMNDFNWNKLI